MPFSILTMTAAIAVISSAAYAQTTPNPLIGPNGSPLGTVSTATDPALLAKTPTLVGIIPPATLVAITPPATLVGITPTPPIAPVIPPACTTRLIPVASLTSMTKLGDGTYNCLSAPEVQSYMSACNAAVPNKVVGYNFRIDIWPVIVGGTNNSAATCTVWTANL